MAANRGRPRRRVANFCTWALARSWALSAAYQRYKNFEFHFPIHSPLIWFCSPCNPLKLPGRCYYHD